MKIKETKSKMNLLPSILLEKNEEDKNVVRLSELLTKSKENLKIYDNGNDDENENENEYENENENNDDNGKNNNTVNNPIVVSSSISTSTSSSTSRPSDSSPTASTSTSFTAKASSAPLTLIVNEQEIPSLAMKNIPQEHSGIENSEDGTPRKLKHSKSHTRHSQIINTQIIQDFVKNFENGEIGRAHV